MAGLLPREVLWHDAQAVYAAPISEWFRWSLQPGALPVHGPKDLKGWSEFWGDKAADARQGPVRYQGGSLLTKLEVTPEALTAQDFRLRPDSAGYRAGKDGKDLGADVDLVGPGPGYERWKKTPDYQQWLKDTGQSRGTVAPKPERGAFVLLGGKGVAERKFDSLGEAVHDASDGDIIEIRGNGPFVTEPIVTGAPPASTSVSPSARPVWMKSTTACTTAHVLRPTRRMISISSGSLVRRACEMTSLSNSATISRSGTFCARPVSSAKCGPALTVP